MDIFMFLGEFRRVVKTLMTEGLFDAHDVYFDM